MSRSLLPDPALLAPLAQRLRSASAPALPAWPDGAPESRILAEYLVGRAHGVLDVSGRRSGGADRDGAVARDGGAEPAGSAERGGDGQGGSAPQDGGAEATGGAPHDGGPVPTGSTVRDTEGFADLPLLVIDDDEAGALWAVAAGVAVGSTSLAAEGLAVEGLAADIPGTHGCAADDRAGKGAVPAGGRVLAYNDRVSADPAARAAGAELVGALPADVVERAPLRCIIAAPKAVDALRETLQALEGIAAEVIVVGRDKHLSPALNAELQRFFRRVDVSPGIAKSRLIIASQPIASAGRPMADEDAANTEARIPEAAGALFPRWARRACDIPGVTDIDVAAHGACFGGNSVDPGSQLLLQAIAQRAREGVLRPSAVLDLGCGNGWLLAAAAALLGPERAVGTDDSRAACASAAATLRAAGTSARIVLSDAGADLGDGTFDLVMLNPPFHAGTAVTTEDAHRMIDAAHRLLAPGGWLVCVFNSHLRYRSHLNAAFGGSEQWARNAKFTVVAARRD
ncbi:methyltransferase [Brevibacterium sp. BRM-1]|uniref:class I SAM-dependent methyltransferase n=1 Tax=Brevibacterium sp. BRM-1 TaxID=2999062 RepID=UPI00227DE582|nr:methyltransferase [Brevibacterium sp. BRM-1]WAL41443.1 methyltransferase [Brevibacterium sp. BRM-1]